MPFVPDAQQPGTPKFVPDTPATQAPAAQGAVAAFIDALGKAVAIPGKPEANLAALANHITSFLPGQQSYTQGTAQQAATEAANPSSSMIGAGVGHLGEALAAGAVAAPVAGAAATTALGAGRLASALSGAATGAASGAAGSPAAPGTGAAIGAVTGGAGGAIAAPAEATAASKLGLRTATQPGKLLAGSSTGPALRLENAAAGDAAIGREAGLAPGAQPSYSALVDARNAPGKVMTDAANSVTPGPLDATAQTQLAQAGVPKGGTLQPDMATQAQINQTRQQLMAADTGPQHAANLASLRQAGFEAVDGDTAAERNLGRAQLDMADAVQGHIERNLPADGPVSPQEFIDARKALAKNYTATSALKGNSFDLQKLARIQRSAPNLLDGDMDTVANFANNNPEITGHQSQLTAPSVVHDLGGISLAHPATWVQPVTGAAGRAVLRAGSLGTMFGP